MSTAYVRPKFTDAEARALWKLGRHLLDDEHLAVEIFATALESSSAWNALRKLVEAIASEGEGRKVLSNGKAKSKAKGKK